MRAWTIKIGPMVETRWLWQSVVDIRGVRWGRSDIVIDMYIHIGLYKDIYGLMNTWARPSYKAVYEDS